MANNNVTYTLVVFQKNTEQDNSEAIRMAVNKALTGKGHVNKAERSDGAKEKVQQEQGQ